MIETKHYKVLEEEVSHYIQTELRTREETMQDWNQEIIFEALKKFHIQQKQHLKTKQMFFFFSKEQSRKNLPLVNHPSKIFKEVFLHQEQKKSNNRQKHRCTQRNSEHFKRSVLTF